MRYLPALGLLTLLAGGSLSAARADIEFIGILATSQATRFALADTMSGRTDWVVAGGAFAGYTIVSYRPKDDTLLLRRGAEELRVRLKDEAKVKAGRVELTGTITFGASEKIQIERATLLFDQENVFPLNDGYTYRITPTRLQDNTVRYAIAVERVLSPTRTETIAVPSIITRPGQPFSLSFAEDLAFTFTPR